MECSLKLKKEGKINHKFARNNFPINHGNSYSTSLTLTFLECSIVYSMFNVLMKYKNTFLRNHWHNHNTPSRKLRLWGFGETHLNLYIVVKFLASGWKCFCCAEFKIPQFILHSDIEKQKRKSILEWYIHMILYLYMLPC